MFSFFIFTAHQFQQSTIFCVNLHLQPTRENTQCKRVISALDVGYWRSCRDDVRCGLRPGIRTVPYRNAPVHTAVFNQLSQNQWSCEAGGSPDEARLEQTSYPFLHPTNLTLFGHKITLYRFNQGSSYYCRGLKSEQGLSPPPGPLTLATA